MKGDPYSRDRTTSDIGGKLKSGAPCEGCGMAYNRCTDKVLSRGRYEDTAIGKAPGAGSACCSWCGHTDTHDERAELVTVDPTLRHVVTIGLPSDLGAVALLLRVVGYAWPDATMRTGPTGSTEVWASDRDKDRYDELHEWLDAMQREG